MDPADVFKLIEVEANQEVFKYCTDSKGVSLSAYIDMVKRGAESEYPPVNKSIGSLVIAFTYSFHYLYKGLSY